MCLVRIRRRGASAEEPAPVIANRVLPQTSTLTGVTPIPLHAYLKKPADPPPSTAVTPASSSSHGGGQRGDGNGGGNYNPSHSNSSIPSRPPTTMAAATDISPSAAVSAAAAHAAIPTSLPAGAGVSYLPRTGSRSGPRGSTSSIVIQTDFPLSTSSKASRDNANEQYQQASIPSPQLLHHLHRHSLPQGNIPLATPSPTSHPSSSLPPLRHFSDPTIYPPTNPINTVSDTATGSNATTPTTPIMRTTSLHSHHHYHHKASFSNSNNNIAESNPRASSGSVISMRVRREKVVVVDERTGRRRVSYHR